MDLIELHDWRKAEHRPINVVVTGSPTEPIVEHTAKYLRRHFVGDGGDEIWVDAEKEGDIIRAYKRASENSAIVIAIGPHWTPDIHRAMNGPTPYKEAVMTLNQTRQKMTDTILIAKEVPKRYKRTADAVVDPAVVLKTIKFETSPENFNETIEREIDSHEIPR